MQTYFCDLSSPVGQLTLVAGDTALMAVLWEADRPGRVRLEPGIHQPQHPVLKLASEQLNAYFAGQRQGFDLPLAPQGTPFQQRVWQALLTIPYGQTRSYADLAAQIGKPQASRAVGAANGRNPLSIVVPCHRVIGKNGSLTGFAGGVACKQKLLDLEQAHQQAC